MLARPSLGDEELPCDENLRDKCGDLCVLSLFLANLQRNNSRFVYSSGCYN